MCISPIKIRNTNFNSPIRDPTYTKLHDDGFYINVPCGHCPACLALRQSYFVQRMQMENLNNDLWTGMLSYHNDALPSVEINGFKHTYADSRDIQLLNKRLYNDKIFKDGFKWWFISERGSKRHRPHWHFLLSTPKVPGETLSQLYSREKFYWQAILDRWYTNYGSRRKPIKIPNLIYQCKNGKYNYDFHYCNPSLTKDGNMDVAFYASKYYLKPDDYNRRLKSALYLNLDESAFKYYWNILRPKTLSSKCIGDYNDPDIYDYIQMCIDFSLKVFSPYPLFINPISGQTFPLAPYYRKHLTVPQGLAFHDNAHNKIGGFTLSEEYNLDDIKRKYSKHKKVIDRINLRDVSHQILIDNEFSTTLTNLEESTQLSEGLPRLVQSLDDFDCYDFDYPTTLF